MTKEEALKIAKPILFNTEMVRAILDGRKTVTRRVVKHNVDSVLNSPYHKEHPEVSDKQIISKLCMPPYAAGDILYVRETWAQRLGCYWHKAGFIPVSLVIEKWHPSIHMPKEATRIFLRVTDVRVERLQDMKFEDCLNEGAFVYLCVDGYFDRDIVEPEAKKKFGTLWDSTIKKQDLDKYGWDANPWVWVIEFERIEVE